MNYTLLSILLLFISFTTYSQNANYRKLIIKSGAIISNTSYEYDTIRINDYTNKYFIKISKIDSILKNKIALTSRNSRMKLETDGEDFYSKLISNKCVCLVDPVPMPNWPTTGCQDRPIDSTAADETAATKKVVEKPETTNPFERDKSSDIIFIRKLGKTPEIFIILSNLEATAYENVKKQIKTFRTVEKTKTDRERFDKTLDWFIDNGLMPDDDFTSYYKAKGFIKGKVIYSDYQDQKILEKVLDGNEDLLPIAKEKHYTEIKEYFLDKMKTISYKQDLEHKDYYNFSRAVTDFTDYFNNDFDSGDNILNSLLTSDKIDKYDKGNIMKHLLKVVEKWEDKKIDEEE